MPSRPVQHLVQQAWVVAPQAQRHPSFLGRVLGFRTADIGLSELPSILPIALGVLIGALVLQYAPTKTPYLVIAGFVTFAVAMWQLGQSTSASGVGDVALGWQIRGLSSGLQAVSLFIVLLHALPRDKVVYGIAYYNSARQLAGSIGTAA